MLTINSLEFRDLDCAVATALGMTILGKAAVTWIDGEEMVDPDPKNDGSQWPYSLQPVVRNPMYTDPPVPDEDRYFQGELVRTAHNLCGIPRRELMAVPFYHSSAGEAFDLLVGLDGIYIFIDSGMITIEATIGYGVECHIGVLAEGPVAKAATLISQAFLKLKETP